MRRSALLNVAQLSDILPTSVGGGENADGNWSLIARLCGPGLVMLLGFVALTAPCGGSSGLPKEIAAFSGAAVAAFAAVATTPAAAVVANTSRLDIILGTPRGVDEGDFALALDGPICAGIRAFTDAHDHTN